MKKAAGNKNIIDVVSYLKKSLIPIPYQDETLLFEEMDDQANKLFIRMKFKGWLQ